MADDDNTQGQGDPSALTDKTAAHHERLENEGVPLDELVPASKELKKSAAEIAERRVYVYQAVVAHGMPVACVAEDVGVSEKTIYEDLKVIRSRVVGQWNDARKNPERRLEALADTTLRLDMIFQNAMLAAASSETGENADLRAQVQFLRVAMEATSRKAVLLDNAGCLPKRADGHAVEGGGGFELNLKATFGLDKNEIGDRSVGPKSIRRILDMVSMIQNKGSPPAIKGG